jgi:iron complex transport system substrate-binding protein
MKQEIQKGIRTLFLSAVVFPLVLILIGSTAMAALPMKTVTDRNGRTVQVPLEPKRIACFFGPSYEKVFLLGSGDKVATMSLKQSPWAHKINPGLKKAVVMPSYNDPDVEQILQLGVDLVFYWQWPQQTEKMASAGIPVVCPYDPRKPLSSLEFMQRFKEEIRFYGEVLGPKARKIAESYCSYYDEKMKRVVSITAKVPDSKRPRVYYIAGRGVFATQGGAGIGRWLLDLAGGNMVSKGLDQNFVDVSMEQVIAWNPDVILVGGQASPDTILSDPRWKSIRAVRENRVYPCPEGVFLWGNGSSESHLFVMWLAKIFHPEKFRNLDLDKEIREYYSRYYHYTPTRDEVARILKRMPPADRERSGGKTEKAGSVAIKPN